jgi:hypothetical protein
MNSRARGVGYDLFAISVVLVICAWISNCLFLFEWALGAGAASEKCSEWAMGYNRLVSHSLVWSVGK